MQRYMHTYMHACTPVMQLHLCANADTDTHSSSALLLHPALPMQILPVQSCAMQIPSPGPHVPKAMPMAIQGGGMALHSTGSSTPLRLVPCQPGTALGTAASSGVGDVSV